MINGAYRYPELLLGRVSNLAIILTSPQAKGQEPWLPNQSALN
jgi:hypothetical protein